MRPSSSSATHAELLLCRRHTPASSATHAELHRHRRHTPDVGTRRRLRLRRHTPTSSAPATHSVEHITPCRIDTRSTAAVSPLATTHRPTHGPATSPCRRQRALRRCTEPPLLRRPRTPLAGARAVAASSITCAPCCGPPSRLTPSAAPASAPTRRHRQPRSTLRPRPDA